MQKCFKLCFALGLQSFVLHPSAAEWWSTWRDEGILLSFTHILKLPHGSTHRRAPGTEWYSLPGSFIVPLHVCFSVFADHSPNRSIERGVCATSMNNFPRTRPVSGSDEDSLRCEQTESLGHYLTSSMDTKETSPLLIRVFFC